MKMLYDEKLIMILTLKFGSITFGNCTDPHTLETVRYTWDEILSEPRLCSYHASTVNKRVREYEHIIQTDNVAWGRYCTHLVNIGVKYD